MSEKGYAQHVENEGGKLLSYQQGFRAVLRLRDGRRVSITIEQGRAELRRSYWFLDRVFPVKPLAVLDLEELYEAQNNTKTPFDKAAVLDTLIENVSECRSPDDVRIRATTGNLDPFGP